METVLPNKHLNYLIRLRAIRIEVYKYRARRSGIYQKDVIIVCILIQKILYIKIINELLDNIFIIFALKAYVQYNKNT
jgi:hypothetical protein